MNLYERRIEKWIVNSVIIPLSPILAALGFAILQGTDLEYQEILGRTEIYMVSVIMLASTKRDLSNAQIGAKRLTVTGRLVEWLTPTLIVICMIYGVIFFNANINSVQISQTATANLGVILATFVFGMCALIQRSIRRQMAIESKGSPS
ncbi:MAG: hypothetical protein OXE52_15375 [Chloroflexi bacterium]|nr:hypothetical protein [Chloroflexota bacterium]